jgi:hypothetical protein
MISMVGGAGIAFFGSRMIPQNLPMLAQYNSGIVGYALNAGSGLAISWALGKFWNRQAGIGALVGTGVAIIARIISDRMATATPASTANASAAVSGLGADLDMDLGYYVSDRFPFPQGNGGPFDVFPGSPYLQNPPFPATSASAVRAGAAAATMALPPANLPGNPSSAMTERWSNNWS